MTSRCEIGEGSIVSNYCCALQALIWITKYVVSIVEPITDVAERPGSYSRCITEDALALAYGIACTIIFDILSPNLNIYRNLGNERLNMRIVYPQDAIDYKTMLRNIYRRLNPFFSHLSPIMLIPLYTDSHRQKKKLLLSEAERI